MSRIRVSAGSRQAEHRSPRSHSHSSALVTICVYLCSCLANAYSRSMAKLRVAIHGAAGRMGQRLVALGLGRSRSGRSSPPSIRPTHPRSRRGRRRDRGRRRARACRLAGRLGKSPDVVIDFSVPAAAEAITGTPASTESCRWWWPRPVSTNAQQQMLRDAAQSIPLLWSPSMSLTVNLAMKLAETAAGRWPDHPAGRRRRDHRAAPSLQGRRAQRHGAQVRRDRRRGDGPHAARPRPRRPARQAAARRDRLPRGAHRRQSRASTRSSSACWAKRWS